MIQKLVKWRHVGITAQNLFSALADQSSSDIDWHQLVRAKEKVEEKYNLKPKKVILRVCIFQDPGAHDERKIEKWSIFLRNKSQFFFNFSGGPYRDHRQPLIKWNFYKKYQP